MIIKRVTSTSNFITWFGSLLLFALFSFLAWRDYQRHPVFDVLQQWALALMVSELILLLLLSDMQRITRRLMSELKQSQALKYQQDTQQAEQYQKALSTLNDIAASFTPDWHLQMQQALRIAAEYLQLPNGIISQINDQDYQVLVHSTTSDQTLDDQHFELGHTYCSITLQSEHLVAIDSMGRSKYAKHPCYADFKLESYIGVVLRVEGKTFGTVNFFSALQRPLPFSQLERDFVSLLGRWISSTLERRHHLQAKSESAERLAKITSQLPGMVFQLKVTATGQRQLPYCSEGIQQLFHLSPADVAHDTRAMLDRVHPEDLPLLFRSFALSAKTLTLWKHDFRIVYPDATTLWVSGQAMPEAMPDGSTFWYGAVNDISERKRIERLKDEFVSTVSHELRTPLTAIAGAIGLLNGNIFGKLPEQASQMVALAQSNVQKLQLLINDLLDMDKLVAGKMIFDMQVQPLQPIIDAALRDNMSYARQFSVNFNLQIQAENLWINADSLRLQQVLTNLLSNAAKFSPVGAEVQVVVSRLSGHARVDVIDKGPGINEQFKPFLFSKFSQADSSDSKSKGGTGLGLAISQQLMHRMQGEIGVVPSPEQGADFYILLPLVEISEQEQMTDE